MLLVAANQLELAPIRLERPLVIPSILSNNQGESEGQDVCGVTPISKPPPTCHDPDIFVLAVTPFEPDQVPATTFVEGVSSISLFTNS